MAEYTSERALAWLAEGRCPECGGEVREHTGWGRAGCTLTDNGVALRVHEYQQRGAGEGPPEDARGARSSRGLTKRDREWLIVGMTEALSKNPGSPYVSLYIPRKRAESLLVTLTGGAGGGD